MTKIVTGTDMLPKGEKLKIPGTVQFGQETKETHEKADQRKQERKIIKAVKKNPNNKCIHILIAYEYTSK